jgi:ABC-2 type transport system permease protein
MRALLILTWHDLRIFFSHRGNWVGFGVLPVVWTLVFGFAMSGSRGPESLRVDVIDQDQSEQSARLLADLRQTNHMLVLCPQKDGGDNRCGLAGQTLTLESGMARVRAGESAALIVIPAGYAAALAANAKLELAFYSATDPFAPDPVRQSLETVVEQVNSAALTVDVVGAVLEQMELQRGPEAAVDTGRDQVVHTVYTKSRNLLAGRPPAVRVVTTASQSERLDQGFGQAVPGIGSMGVLFVVLGGMASLQRERQRWTLQRLGALPLRRSQILGGKMLTYLSLGMLQYGLAFAVGLAVGLDVGPKPLLVLAVMGAFALCCTGLTFAIAPLLTSERQASVVAQLLALTFAALGGAWWPLEIVPHYMQQIGHLSPVAWAMDAFRTLLFYGGGLAEILPQLAVLLAAALMFLGLGIWRFRYR